MAEYIAKEKALDEIDEWIEDGNENNLALLYARKYINLLTPVDVRPVVRGVWLNTTEQNELHDTCVSCSICGDSYVLDDWGIEDLKEMFNFCPNCGADMRPRPKEETCTERS